MAVGASCFASTRHSSAIIIRRKGKMKKEIIKKLNKICPGGNIDWGSFFNEVGWLIDFVKCMSRLKRYKITSDYDICMQLIVIKSVCNIKKKPNDTNIRNAYGQYKGLMQSEKTLARKEFEELYLILNYCRVEPTSYIEGLDAAAISIGGIFNNELRLSKVQQLMINEDKENLYGK